MVCPKCGNIIADGHLYCEVCGEEIQIVPDFDPQLEESINVTLSSVASEVVVPTEPKQKDKPTEIRKSKSKPRTKVSLATIKAYLFNKKRLPYFIVGAALVVLLISGLIVYAVLRNNASDEAGRFEKAKTLYDEGRYEDATEILQMLINSDEQSGIDAVLLLFDSYYALNRYDDAIVVLSAYLPKYQTDDRVIERMLSAYAAAEDYKPLISLLKQCDNPEILAMYADYLAPVPLFSMQSGTYSDEEQLSLLSEKEGEIRYTLDGTTPTMESACYSTPFIFEPGEHIVTAIFVNSKGIVSEPVQNKYVIEHSKLDDPVLLTEPGAYENPELIRLEKPVGAVIYYTDDGTDPTSESNVYNQPIPMPIRQRVYKFIVIDADGKQSDIVEATYSLQMVTLIDVPMAESAIALCLNLGGSSVKKSEYNCSCAYRYNGKNYYLVEEFSTQSESVVKTGRVYAVDVLSGELYKVDMSSAEGDYQLTNL